jgi:hypothetical protein
VNQAAAIILFIHRQAGCLGDIIVQYHDRSRRTHRRRLAFLSPRAATVQPAREVRGIWERAIARMRKYTSDALRDGAQ